MTTSNAQLVDALRTSLRETERLKQQNRRLVEAGSEPIAIVGASCRFPGGVDTPEQLWDLVARGRDAMTPFPADRGWDVDGLYDPDPDRAGTTYVREGGFLHDAALFDPAFFGISPREALAMDPQQRLLLESSWEALERAGLDPGTLAGSRTGVFVGVIHNDYTSGLRTVPDDLEAFLGNGGAASVASGRVAYTLGLEGPAISVDTACSSSLVALHLAVQSLRRGECAMALAGGASVMATPGAFTEFSRQRGLGRDGRCKPFATAADGTGWGEGVGMLVLERLSEAQRLGHRILAVVRGSAVNQDGASNGLSAPNGPAQRRVIRAALENAGLQPSDVDAVEAHGTGTTLGDPIEAQALLATYGQDRDGEPLWLGSFKSNVGHTMAAAGVGGVLKMIMAMRYGTLPESLHVDEPTNRVDWESGAVSLLTSAREWPAVDRPRRAGVSSFGISGTNAHLILEQAPPVEEPPRAASAPVVPWVVSAKSEAALGGQIDRLAAAGGEPLDIARSLVSTRALFGHRVVAVGSTSEELIAGLRSAVPVEAVAGRGPVFVFPGQGAQWVGMALDLVAESPVFAAALRECADALAPHVDWDLFEALRSEELLARVDVVQPASFAVHVALARLWESVGVRPAAVLGHSQGEIAAAHVAGLLSLVDAARVVAVRSRVLTALAGTGLMASIGLPESALTLPDGVSVAAVNAATSTVIAGEPGAVRQVVADAEALGVRARLIAVDYASHSPMVESLRESLLTELGEVRAAVGVVPMLSTVTGEWIDAASADYWIENLRRPVRFADAVSTLTADGFGLFVEVSAHPVVSVPLSDMVPGVVGTLRRDEGGWRRFLASAGEAFAAGAEVDWVSVLPADARLVDLPTYAFDRDRFWLENTGGPGDLAAAGLGGTEHPLLPAAVVLPDGEGVVLTGRISAKDPAWLTDHAVLGTVLLPGAAFVEMAVRAGDEVGCDRVEELTLAAPLVLGDRPVLLRVVAGAADSDGRRPVTIHSSPDGETWATHAVGTLAIGSAGTVSDLTTWPPAGAQPVSTDGLYAGLAADGYRYGPTFRGVRRVWRRGDDVYAEVALPEQAADAARFGLHPALLDAALHAIGIDGTQDSVRLPFSWTGVTLHASGTTGLRVHLAPAGDDTVRIALADLTGAPVATVEAMTLRPISADGLAAPSPADEALFRVAWTAIEAPAAPAEPVTVTDLGDLTGDVPATVVLRLPDIAEGDPHRATVQALELAQQWLADDRFAGSRLAVVTTRAVVAAPGERLGSLAYAPVWGLLRAAQAENPDRFLLADTDGSEAARAALPAALAAGEPEVALRGNTVLARRLVRVRARDTLVPPAGGAPWRLDATVRESLENLEFVPAPEAHAPLAAGEVRVGVRAAGINFRDLVSLLGMAATEEVMGGEAAGVVLEAGPGVTDLKAGDRVAGLFVGAFGPVAVTQREFLARMPAGWSFARAAAVPIAYLTAYYGLVDLAGVRAGQRVLVHAGAGGVGMAAVQLARSLGAEVFATANPAKWDVLRGLGLDDDHIASTRDLTFAAKFAEVTGGTGMDVVLDSLAREFVDASLGLLPRGGHFLEMGKTDIRDAAEVAERHPGVRYRAYDLVEAGPARTAEMLAHLLSLLGSGELAGLPVTAWDVRRATEAFRFMSQARHVGKIVLTVPRAADPAGTVVVTGGLGTVGALVARRLVTTHGVRELVLTGRRGLATDGAPELVADLEALGARVTVVAGDVSDRSVVRRVLAAVPAGAPLTGVVHAAGVLDDGLVSSLTPERVRTVFAPKVDAAIHLDELTRDADLAFFAVFSSAAATLGESGQGNYAAANVFLENLIESRRRAGLPGSALAWGFWEERSSMTAHLSDVDVRRMARGGVLPLSSELGVELFDAGIGSPWPVVAPVRLDLPALRSAGQLPAVLRTLVGAVVRRTAGAAVAANDGLADRIRGLPAADRERALLDLVRSHVGFVLGFAEPERIGAGRAFKEIGFDSLTAVELRNRLGAATGLRLPATLVFDYPSPGALARHLVGELTGDDPARVPDEPVAAAADAEPIAIVGMSCHFPGGADSPEQLWDLLAQGRDAMTPFPADRGWDVDGLYDPDPDRTGTSYVREGGFLHDAALFDAGFFGISPREALAMDPQQRLLLESSWEALERAGIDPATVRGSRTGVFVGVITNDYTTSVGLAPEDIQPFLGNGGFNSVASGRVAYTLGLEGPAISVDTACSSSLVALHLAVQSLRRGECTMALAGGASVMATPIAFTDFSRQRGMAADGRCKSFAAAADGTGWGEGAGMLVLERLSDARAKGHHVLAVVRGSAVNQDGASNGLTAPNGPSQMRVIRQALADASLRSSDVDAVEAHGTGTTLGDPIEAQALLATYGQDRDGEPLWLGSLKSNIGHTQAAAGVGGIIKLVMAMRHGVLPQTLHVDEPSHEIDWESGAVSLLTSAREWPALDRPRRAGVSSFGISGTNAHVILEHAPQESPAPSTGGTGVVPWVVSAKTAGALSGQVGRLAAAAGAVAPADIARSLVSSRALFGHRVVAVGSTSEELIAGLRSAVPVEAVAGRGPVFVFPGQGAQWVGMALDLVAESPVFAAALRECAEALAPHVDWDLFEALGSEELLARVDVVQPASFAVHVALARLWESVGVRPAAVLGHSQGEIAAAHVAGLLSLADAARVVAVRSRVLTALAGTGLMASIGLPESDLTLPQGVSVAAVNAATSTVIAGEPDAVRQVVADAEALGVRARLIAVDYASHSPMVESLRESLLTELGEVRAAAGVVPMLSTVTGEWIDATSADYWFENLRRPVRFADAVSTLTADGFGLFVEVSAHPVVSVPLSDMVPGVVGTLRRDEGGWRRFLASAGEAFAAGAEVDWGSVLPADARLVDLPTYAFEHQRYWLEAAPGTADVAAAGLGRAEHPLLGAVVPVAGADQVVLTGRLSRKSHPWLADHAVLGTALLPGTAFVELAIRAGDEVGCARLDELTLLAPLVIPADGAVRVQATVGAPDDDGRREVAVHSQAGDGGEWITHAAGLLAGEPGPAGFDLVAWPPAGAEPIDLGGGYDDLAGRGYEYGPSFRGLRAAWRRGAEIFADVALPQDAKATGFVLHPALFDAALHALGLGTAGAAVQLPFSWTGVTVHAAGATTLRVRLSPSPDGRLALAAADAGGAPVVSVDALVLRPVTEAQLRGATSAAALHTVGWTPIGDLPATAPGRWAVLGAHDLGLPAAARHDDLDALLAAGGDAPEVVFAPITGDGRDLPASVRATTGHALDLVQRWLADDRMAGSRLVLVTTGAVAGGPDLAAAAVWGLVRSAEAENPDRFGLLDHDRGPIPWPAVIAALPGETELSVRDGELLVPRLARSTVADQPAGFDPGGAVLLTGGTGTIGAHIARRLVTAHGVRRLVITSRRGPDAEGAAELRADLAALGAEAEIVACAADDRPAMAGLFAAHPIRAVVHAAGVTDDGVVASLDPARLDTVMRPKVDAAVVLHDLTRDRDLTAFVLFSSGAGTFGSAGQANYAAANAFLDALAGHRRSLGLPGTSIAWGFWAQRSELTGRLGDADVARMGRSGIAAMDTGTGLALFDAALATPDPAVVAARFDLDRLRSRAADNGVPPALRALVRAPSRRATAAGAGSASEAEALRRRIAALPPDQAAAAVLDLVRMHVAGVLGFAGPHAVDADRGLVDLGFDSLTALELRNRLGRAIGSKLPATLVFDYPTATAVAGHLLDRLPADAPAAAPALAELDRLEALLAGPMADQDRTGVRGRLQELLKRLGDDLPEELGDASDEEMFAFIDSLA
ncbi:SDR family NAD(P)-dependent oxidoreductase [Actinoplanes sp. NPDC026623]|uniref:SDR family NAD(P)-dependent oxidoreductase n=1 Tax=Actinoplanes sp. NPDC026623 TaxID=3155610 RepID=UPI00340246D3